MSISPKSFIKELNSYNAQLASNRIQDRIPQFWVIGHDHITYQVKRAGDFNDFLQGMSQQIGEVTVIEHEGPFEVAVKLLGQVSVGGQGRIKWINLREIDAQQEGPHWEGISALNILIDSLDTTANRIAAETNLDFISYTNRVEVKINDKGQALNFVEIPLSERTERAKEDGIAIPIYPKGSAKPGVIRSQEQ